MEIGNYLIIKDQLKDDYLKTFEFIEQYGLQHMITEDVMAEKMMDLIDLLLEAQNENVPAEKIVGTDKVSFCREYFSDFSFKDLLKSAAKTICTPAWFVFILEILNMLTFTGEDGFNFFSYKSYNADLLLSFTIGWNSYIISDVIGYFMAKSGCYSRRINSIIKTIMLVISFIAIIVINIIIGDKNIVIPGSILIICSGIYLAVYYGIRFVKTGTLKKQENLYKSTFSSLVKQEIKKQDHSKDVTFVKAFARRYKKENLKRQKKGKEKLTTQAFFEKYNHFNKILLPICYASGFVIAFMFTLLSSGFESFTDAIIFFIIMGIVFLLVMKFLKKIERITVLGQKDILSACKSENVEIDTYYDTLIKEKRIE